MKKIIAFVLCLITTISISGCGKTTTWNGTTAELGNLQMVVDFTNMNEYVGLADYVFVGTIEEVVNNVLPDKMKKHEDGYSTYRIHVDENLKGNLVEEIICSKLGGLKKDGTMYLITAETPNGKVATDTGLPELNHQYIFLAYGQPDGSLTLSEILDNREFSDELLQEYRDYINNQIVFDRERCPSKYDRKE